MGRPEWIASQSTLCGVGLELFRERKGDVLKVAAVHPGSSAHSEGILPGNSVTCIDGLDSSLMSLEQAKSSLMGSPTTQIAVDVSTAPLPPGNRRLMLVRGQGQSQQPPSRHDFHRQKRPVQRDSLVHTLAHSASPAQSAELLPTVSGRSGHATDRELEFRGVQREYDDQIASLSSQLRSATEENALLRELAQAHTTPPINAAEKEELLLARQILADIHSHHEHKLPQNTKDNSAIINGLKRELETGHQSLAALQQENNTLQHNLELNEKKLGALESRDQTLQQQHYALLQQNDVLEKQNNVLHQDLELTNQKLLSGFKEAPATAGATLTKVSDRKLEEIEREMESLRLLLRQANDGMQNMEDEKQRLESEVQRSKFHETAFIDRGDQLQERERQLLEARRREEDSLMRIVELEKETKGVRAAALADKRNDTNQSQAVESLQQQLEQMQLLALSQSREAETAMMAMGELKSIEMEQGAEIYRLNGLVGELEKHQKVQIQRVDASAHRWKLKRDQVVEELDNAKLDILRRDEVIEKHRLLISEYQSVLEVVKKAGGATKAFKTVK